MDDKKNVTKNILDKNSQEDEEEVEEYYMKKIPVFVRKKLTLKKNY